MTNINRVLIEGVIVHKYVTPKIVILTINTGSASQEANNPTVLFFPDKMQNVIDNYAVKDHVVINGYLQSAVRRPEIKKQNTLFITGDTIAKSKPIGTLPNGKPQYAFQNFFEAEGKITQVEEVFNNLVRVRMFTLVNGHPSFLNLVCYTNNPEKMISKLNVDDDLHVTGCIQTLKKVIDGETRYFENYVIRKFKKIES